MEETMSKRFGAIMFDLDGTLLPMDTEQFMGAYFKELGDYFAANGYTREEIIPKVRHATRAMIFNDGKKTNSEGGN
jgi:phosphoglycolate phosphatase-like HAD superfamily hydrolase